MVDRITKQQRSKNMAAVKSRGNKSTEQRLLNVLRESKISGWRRHYKRLPGTPDFAFLKQKVAVFVDGCFWHGCKKCKTIPKTNTKFWVEKITKNIERDKRKDSDLRKKGWRSIHIKEHSLRSNSREGRAETKIRKALRNLLD